MNLFIAKYHQSIFVYSIFVVVLLGIGTYADKSFLIPLVLSILVHTLLVCKTGDILDDMIDVTLELDEELTDIIDTYPELIIERRDLHTEKPLTKEQLVRVRKEIKKAYRRAYYAGRR